MRVPDHIFRAYDIRGVAAAETHASSAQADFAGLRPASRDSQQAEITPEVARALGWSFGEYLKISPSPSTDQSRGQALKKSPPAPLCERGEQKGGIRVVVGHDNRLTGESLSAALIEGLASTGVVVTDIGHATSPYLYFATCFGDFDGGINVTGSHNPAEYNGFKLVGKGAAPIAGDEIQELKNLIKESSPLEKISPNPSLRKRGVSSGDLKQEYFKKLTELAPLKRKLKVVLDCGNGTAGYFAPEFFRLLGCEVVELYCTPDGTFPNHLPNPEETESLRDLQAKVLETRADMGLAFDGDGDRVGVVDERGEIISPDRLIVLLARDLLARRPGAEIIFDVKCSNVLPAEITKAGGRPLRWKTGHSFIKQKMRETGALLAGEVSGHIFFAEDYYGVDDGLLAAAKVASIVSQRERSLSTYFADLPQTFTTPELKAPIDDTVKFAIMEKVKKDLLAKYTGDTLDGVRIELPDGAWALVRPSNTSPYLTIRCEAPTAEQLVTVKQIIVEVLAKYPVIDSSALK